MRINLELDDNLVEQALTLTGLETEQELVTYALAELVISQSPKNLLDLAGQIEFKEDFDPDEVRINRYVID